VRRPDTGADPASGTYVGAAGPSGAPGRDPYAEPGGGMYGVPGQGANLPVHGETAPYEVAGSRRPPWAGTDAGSYADGSYGDDTYYDDYADDDAGGEVEELPRRRGCRNALVVLAVLVLAACVAGWFGWSWVQGEIDPAGGPGERVLVEIPEGTSTAGIGQVLADAGVISNAGVWNWYTKLRDVGSIQAGSYEMRLNSSFTEAIDDLKGEPLPPNSRLVTVPEGLTQAQVVARLVDPEKGVPGFTPENVQAALADPASRSAYLPPEQPLLEGTLFPETYTVEEGDTEAVVVQRMVRQFDEVMTELDANGRAAALGFSPYQALIVASMVEREAGTPADMPKVARVIYNRLGAGEALQIDATSCYEKGQIPCELTDADFQSASPYNTRNTPGLPPTPIASPGRASIEAALAPAVGDWRWYVVDADAGDGSSFFTSDYDEFLAAKERCEAAGLGCG
jgi:UPF0755 protein